LIGGELEKNRKNLFQQTDKNCQQVNLLLEPICSWSQFVLGARFGRGLEQDLDKVILLPNHQITILISH
jgi:hypothetical protein